MDVAGIIEAIGGRQAACSAFEVARSTISLWEAEGFPPKRWREIQDKLRACGVVLTLEQIGSAAPVKRPEAA
jgi:hypothetical protein